MALAEPGPEPGEIRFRLFGFPVHVNPAFWLTVGFLGLVTIEARDGRGAIEELLLWTVAAFLSILIHELGHAAVMRRFGYQPSITLCSFGGYASYNTDRLPGPFRQVLISAAGPAAQLALMAALAALLYCRGYALAIYHRGPAWLALPADGETIVAGGATLFVSNLMLVSAAWAYLNLIPIYPMDGGRIARGLLELATPLHGAHLSLVMSVLIGVGLAVACLAIQSTFLACYFAYLTITNIQALRQNPS